jgi:simple sugar transport system ATP-binding protein
MTMTEPAAPEVEVVGLSKRFGSVQALDAVSVQFSAGRMHALLGENGAGKSTLVKCLMGYHRADRGSILVDGHERAISLPPDAHALGLGMVYQHFTLVRQMTVAENFVLGRARVPAIIDWNAEHAALREFMARMPFTLDPTRRVATLAAGEKQKLEILKQLYLERRFLVLDEPTSVLTPNEADEVLGEMRRLTQAGRLTVVLITHKLSEVMRFADDVTILRAGKVAGQMDVASASEDRLAAAMFGGSVKREPAAGDSLPLKGGGELTPSAQAAHYLVIDDLHAMSDRGTPAVVGASVAVKPGEIVGIAGVSGNGQRELVEVLAGQRDAERGTVFVAGKPFAGTRAQLRQCGVSLVTEEPLANAAVRSLSVMENLSLRAFDRPPLAAGGWRLRRRAMRPFAEALMARYGIRASSPLARLDTLSGGNVQRTVLARELSRDVRLLVVQNPCFGLDAAAVAAIRGEIRTARDKGAAVLLISEDLDEILELADRILVMSGGRIAYATRGAGADRYEIGRHMAQDATRLTA